MAWFQMRSDPAKKKAPVRKPVRKKSVKKKVARPPAKPAKKKVRKKRTRKARGVGCGVPAKPGRKRSGYAYRDTGLSCGVPRGKTGWKQKHKAAQAQAWSRGRIPDGWPRLYRPQSRPFEHGRTAPVKFSVPESLRRSKAWKSIPAHERAKHRGENPRVTEIPIASHGDPDLRWFAATGGKVLVQFSGGKDSLALLLYVIEVCLSLGLDPGEHVEAWHQAVDGKPVHLGGESSESCGKATDYKRAKWDWPVTESYCMAVCECLGIPLFFGWRVGGLQGTVLKGECRAASRPAAEFELPEVENVGTAKDKVWVQTGRAVIGGSGGGGSDKGVRMSYPMTGANLKTRWCSGEAKIDVAKSQIAQRVELRGNRILYVSGERAEESVNRATYVEREFWGDLKDNGEIRGVHAAHGRHAEKWKPILSWCELDVWAIIRRWGISPHPAYELGFGRLSCMTCIFGNKNQWATVKKLDPKRFAQFTATEKELAARKAADVKKGVAKAEKRIASIKRGKPLPVLVEGGVPYRGDWSAADQAMSSSYTTRVRISPRSWRLPAGAFGEDTGPT